MNKATKINHDKAICDILSAVADDTDLDTLKAKTTAICRQYFPNADLTMLNTFNDFGHFAQHYFGYLQYVGAEVNRYYRENRAKSPTIKKGVADYLDRKRTVRK